MMTEQEYASRGLELSSEANVLDGLHNYFMQQVTRLHKTCQLFGLYDGKLGDVLDIGPFYSYTPFVLRSHAETYTVLEGDDPAVYPLKPLYAKHKVTFEAVDLFEMFGPTHGAAHAFKYRMPPLTRSSAGKPWSISISTR